jgi:lipopolysaccharide export system protein LptA
VVVCLLASGADAAVAAAGKVVGGRIAAPKAAGTPVPTDVLEMEADRTEYDDKARVYVLAGKVRIRMRDIQVTCREAILEMDARGEGLEVMRLQGQVRAVRGRQVFRGERITWLAAARRFVAEGDVEARVPWPSTATAESMP